MHPDLDHEQTLKHGLYENINLIIMAHVNISSPRNKLNLTKFTWHVKRNVGTLVISETMLSSSFSEEQFRIPEIASPF